MKTNEMADMFFPELKNDDSRFAELVKAVSGKRAEELLAENKEEQQTTVAFYHFTADSIASIRLNPSMPFANFYRFLVSEAFKEFHMLLERYPFIENKVEFAEEVFSQVIEKLWSLSYRSLIQLMKSTSLQGRDEKERFHYFNEVLLSDEKFVNEYLMNHPVFAESLQKEMERSIAYIRLVLDHCHENLGILKSRFSKKTLTLQKISVGKGDTHQNGKTVSLLYFEELTLVYKPRSLAIDASYQEFLAYLNKEVGLDFKEVEIVTFQDFGFMEFIEHKPCEKEEELDGFYRKVGYHLANFYLLNGNDMHFENVIANGAEPVFIDLESLFAPQLAGKYNNLDASLRTLYRQLEASVQGISLLSTEIGSRQLMDIGGIAKNNGQTASYRSAKIKDAFTDQMSYQLVYPKVDEKQNNPFMDGKVVESVNYRELIWEGFESLYRHFMVHKDEISKVVEKFFSGQTIRYIHRSTMFYSKLLTMHTYPLFMNDKYLKDLLFHRVGIHHTPQDRAFLNSEYADLHRMDVPYFQANTSSVHIMNSNGQMISNVLEAPPIQASLDKIIKLSDEDLMEQKRLVDITFMNKRKSSQDRTGLTFAIGEGGAVQSDHAYLKTAKEIGDFLVRKMVAEDAHGYWIGPTINLKQKEEAWVPGLIETDVYNGSSGIGIFLAYLYSVTGEEKYRQAAEKSMLVIVEYLEKIEEVDTKPLGVGAFVGFSAYLYGVFKCGEYLKKDDWVLLGFEKLSWLKEKVIAEDITDPDYIYGLTGTIHMLFQLAREFSGEQRSSLMDVLDLLGNQLLKNEPEDMPLSGFAHGLASLMSSFALLSQQFQDPAYEKAVYKCFETMKKFKSTEKGAWFNSLEQQDVSYGFCHGTPGILMAYTICKEVGFPVPEQWLKQSVEHIKNNSFGNTLTYCHGDIGNLEIMYAYAESFGDKALERQVDATVQTLYDTQLSNVLNSKLAHSYVLGVMAGISGAGLFLLNRVAHDSKPTEVLMFT
ncbi:type 2 lanthipeptide synthetase LanM [Planococcus maitriensis]|nr:type 2 lanthipeptide synthetase LanM [Planococcus maitriensis]